MLDVSPPIKINRKISYNLKENKQNKTINKY